MSKTEIKNCSCTHAFQDTVYGAGRRVHNARRLKDGKATGWRCTVCTRESEHSSPVAVARIDRASKVARAKR